MMPYVITLTGPSQSGKSEVIRIFQELSLKNEKFSDFHPIAFQKYTTREFRDDEIKKIASGEAYKLDQKSVIGSSNMDDTIDKDSFREAKNNEFRKLKCDLAYEQYGDRYGLKLADLYKHLKKGETPIVVLNDVRTVEDIKTKLGGQCFSIFTFREAPNFENFSKIGKQRGENPEITKIRFQKAESIYRIYIENIHIFDKLILNVEKCQEVKFLSLEKILKQLITYLCNPMPKFF